MQADIKGWQLKVIMSKLFKYKMISPGSKSNQTLNIFISLRDIIYFIMILKTNFPVVYGHKCFVDLIHFLLKTYITTSGYQSLIFGNCSRHSLVCCIFACCISRVNSWFFFLSKICSSLKQFQSILL